MNAAIISPVALLDRYSSQGKVQLVLAHLWDNKDYRAFMLRQKAKGNFMILDNGAYELRSSVKPSLLMDVAKDLKPDVLTIPDEIMDIRRTLSFFYSFVRDWNDSLELPDTALMPVPQGSTETEWWECYDEMCKASMETFTWWAIPKVYQLVTRQSRRIPALEMAKRSPKANIHLFGIWKDPIEELLDMKDIPQVKSIDSQLPVTLGHLGRTLNECRPHPHGESFDSTEDPHSEWTLARVCHFLEIAKAQGGNLFPEEIEPFQIRIPGNLPTGKNTS